MSERARDPRTLRTVAALREALRESLRDRSLDDVNVSELARLADIRRTTFYTHYSSVAELLTEMLTSEIDDLLELSDAAALSVQGAIAEFQDTLIAAFEIVARDRELFRVGFDSDASAPLRRALTGMFARRVELAIGLWQLVGAALETDAVVAPAFAAGGLTASVEAWALSDNRNAARWAAVVRDQMAPWWPRPTGLPVDSRRITMGV